MKIKKIRKILGPWQAIDIYTRDGDVLYIGTVMDIERWGIEEKKIHSMDISDTGVLEITIK